MDEYGTSPDHDASGGWGYHEWDAASSPAWEDHGEITDRGDIYGADHSASTSSTRDEL